MRNETSVAILFGIIFLFMWIMVWANVGWSAGVRHGRGGMGVLLGLLFGPAVLFVYMIPNAKELKVQMKGKTNE